MGLAQRKERERNARREHILLSARKVFSAKDYRDATVEEIARESELSPATLYLYFKSKEGLYMELNKFLIKKIVDAAIKIDQDKEKNPVDKIHLMKEKLCSEYDSTEYGIFINMARILSDWRRLSIGTQNEMNDLAKPFFAVLRKIFKDGIDEGFFVKENPAVWADIFWANFTGLMLWESNKNVKKDLFEKAFYSSVNIFLRGIQK